MVRREGGRAYLLITFDLPNQKLLSTEEVVGPFDGEFQKVIVDWQRIFGLVKGSSEYDSSKGSRKRPNLGDDDPPKDPPWRRPNIEDEDDPPKGPPWKRPNVDDEDDPPKGPPWKRPNVDDEERPPEL